jgi:hypothetical protein
MEEIDEATYVAAVNSAASGGGASTWSELTGTPTTLAGYGITDAATQHHTHSASDLTSGTVATARLGSGTASAATFLRGDGQWKSVISTSIDGGTATTVDGGVIDGGSATTI